MSKIQNFVEWCERHPKSMTHLFLDFTPTYVVFIDNIARQKYYKPYKHMTRWCEKNCRYRWHGYNHMWWFFEKPSDVILFKLTFL